LFHRRQPEPRATEAGGNFHIGLRKGAEQPLDLLQREADAAVRNRKGHSDLALPFAFRLNGRPHGQPNAALFGELGGIVD